MMPCSLCLSEDVDFFFQKKDQRFYWICSKCELIFVDPQFHISESAEKSRYEEHNNDPSDLRYRKFLNQLVEPLSKMVSKEGCGLDYGCGSGPTLSVMMRENGFKIVDYDPYFFPSQENLKRQYDYIACTEVVEHFNNPRLEFKKLWALLKDNGCLGIRTEVWSDSGSFVRWRYHWDPTHVVFYSRSTFRWLGDWLGAQVEFPRKNVIFLKKTGQIGTEAV